MASGRTGLVEACLNGSIERVCAVVDATPPDHQLYAHCIAIHAAVDALANQSPLPEAYRKIQRALKKPVPDAEILLLSMQYASLLAIRMHRLEEARQMFRLIRQFGSQPVRPEIHAATLLAQASFQEVLADYGPAARLIGQALALKVRKPSVFWVSLKSYEAYYAIYGHDFATAERAINDIEAYPDLQTNLLVPLLGLKVQLCCESGRAEQGLAMLDAAQTDDAGIGRRRYIVLCVQLLLETRRLDEVAIMLDQAQNELAILTKPTYESLRALEALAHHDLEAASAHGRAAIHEVTKGVRVDFDMSLQTLAAVELAGKQAHKARRILKRLDPYASKLPTQMLWARLNLLEGNDERASEHFHKSAALGPTYVAHALRDASELTAYQLARLQAESRRPPQPVQPPSPLGQRSSASQEIRLVGRSAEIRSIRSSIGSFAALTTPVLITGETGTGKDIVARLLHAESARVDEAFIPVNCGALSDTLIESELFGHVKGAFTGADRDHDGLFVAAGQGTIFLDEIHAMSKRLQAALLRVLENGEVRRVGSSQFQRTQSRVIAATNESLQALLQRQQLRSDLYYRLAKLHVHVPPLRDRLEDIIPLAKHFLRKSLGHSEVVLGDDLIAALRRYAWPGNVRELKNEIERIALTVGDVRVLSAGYFKVQHPQYAVSGHPAFESEQPIPSGPNSFIRESADRLPSGRHTHQRRRRLRQLFDEHDQLTRAEVIQLLGCSPNTATRDLRALEQEGVIRRVHTSAHLRTSYFVLNG